MHEPGVPLTADDLLRHARWLRRLAERLVGAGAADDLVQETWLSALRHRPARGAGLGPWLRRVLHNLAVGRSRTQARRRASEVARARPADAPATVELVARAEATRALVDAVLRLDPTKRDVILLRYFDQLTPAAIAARLGLPDATARSHLARGLARLRRDLDAVFAGDRARWMRALAPLSAAPALSSLAVPAAAALAMTTTYKIAAAVLVGAAGIAWACLQLVPSAATPVAAVDPPATAPPSLAAAPAAEQTADAPGAAGTRRATTARRLAGRLLDARSGEPLAHFALGLAAGSPRADVAPERVVTDAAGRFRSARAREPGPMQAVLLEDHDRYHAVLEVFGAAPPRPPVGFTFAADEESELRVASGPSFTIACPRAAALGADRFLALLSDSAEPLGGMYALTHLMQVPHLLARFAPLDPQLLRARPDKLHLLAKDGTLHGWAAAPAHIAGPVAIDLSPCGSLELEVHAAAPPHPDEVRVTAYAGALAAPEVAAAQPLWERMTGGALVALDGSAPPRDRPLRFHVPYQRVGPHTLVLRSRGFDDLVAVVDIEQGDGEPRTVTLVRSADAVARGAIEGLVRSPREPAVELVAWLRAADGAAGSERMVPLQWTREGSVVVARFRFADLVDDEYRVWIALGPRVPRPHPRPRTEPDRPRVRPGAAPLQFELADAGPVTVIEVRARDAGTGEPIQVFQALPLPPEPRAASTPAETGVARIVGDRPCAHVLVHASGHMPSTADVPDAAAADGRRSVQVSLAPGWGALVVVHRDDGGGDPEPLAGATVAIDGVDVAVTDDTGVAVLAQAARPSQLTVRAVGLRVPRRSGGVGDVGELPSPPADGVLEAYGFVLRR